MAMTQNKLKQLSKLLLEWAEHVNPQRVENAKLEDYLIDRQPLAADFVLLLRRQVENEIDD
jgi:hypothetical protein